MADGSFRVVASGIGFTEGPLWLPDGDLLVTSMSRGLIYAVRLSGSGPSMAYETGGGPNGLAIDRDGMVVVAQNGATMFKSRSERRVRPGLQVIRDGEVVDLLAEGCLAPNDLAFAPDGTLWFTDPGNATDPAFAPRVSRYDVATGRLDTVIDDLKLPNGLAFGADGDLFLADSITHEILRFAIGPTGATARTVHAVVPGSGPDGIAFDADGCLYVAAFESNDVVVLDRHGRVARRIPMGAGSRPTNLCFAGERLDTLVVTLASGGRVVALDETFQGTQP